MAGFGLDQLGTSNPMYLSDTGNVTPWPKSLQVVVSKGT